MTRPRIYGEDSDFSGWLRSNSALDSVEFSISVNDRDFTLHKFKTNVDSVGTRAVHLMMAIEVKTRGGMPGWAQRQTKFFEHQLLRKTRRLVCSETGIKTSVWHFGYFVLSLFGTAPQAGRHVTWCRFQPNGAIEGRTIQTAELERILRFEVRPDTLKPLILRRHHKTRHLVNEVQAPLGFTVLEKVVKRS